VDKRTGYRTKQMLVAPVVDAQSNELLGVVQLINNKAGTPFAAVAQEGVKGLCETLAIAFAQRSKPAAAVKTKYDFLVSDAVISAQEMELATRTARRKNLSIEEVLVNEFQVKHEALGAALGKFFNVPYESFKSDRVKPADLLKNLKREFLDQGKWAPVEESPPRPTTNWSSWSTRSSSTPTRWALRHPHRAGSRARTRPLIRFRRDGFAAEVHRVPASYRNAMVARLKIMCDLDISERRKPQDGKIKFKKFGPLDIELRVATIPTTGGVEDVVMRILAAGEPIPLDKLGVLPTNLKRLKATIAKPYGLFFVCGPTGSGKTTTLHSILGYINTPWTPRSGPPKIRSKSPRRACARSRSTRRPGSTFADRDARLPARRPGHHHGRRNARQGNHRAIGIEASLTGHLVFATLHTNSAPESIIRLLDMGMDPFNFADALLGILAQRLAKRLCKCKESYTPDADEVRLFMKEYCSELKTPRHSRRMSRRPMPRPRNG
jgi:hypothetical protein